MWTEEQRRIYRREGEGYPNDLRDAEWARLEPLIPPARPGGRPRKTDMRAAMTHALVVERIFRVLKTGKCEPPIAGDHRGQDDLRVLLYPRRQIARNEIYDVGFPRARASLPVSPGPAR